MHKEFISPFKDNAHFAFNMCDFPIDTHNRLFPRQFCSPWVLENNGSSHTFFFSFYYLPNLFILRLDVMSLTLGSLPKQRHGKVHAKSATRESHSHFRSASECEGMSPHTLKWIPILGVGVLIKFWIFKEQFERSKLIGLRTSLPLENS
jgi:hypothetical protein